MAVFDEVFSLAKPDNSIKAFESAIIEKLLPATKVFDSDKLWAAALVFDRIIKSLQVRQLRL